MEVAQSRVESAPPPPSARRAAPRASVVRELFAAAAHQRRRSPHGGPSHAQDAPCPMHCTLRSEARSPCPWSPQIQNSAAGWKGCRTSSLLSCSVLMTMPLCSAHARRRAAGTGGAAALLFTPCGRPWLLPNSCAQPSSPSLRAPGRSLPSPNRPLLPYTRSGAASAAPLAESPCFRFQANEPPPQKRVRAHGTSPRPRAAPVTWFSPSESQQPQRQVRACRGRPCGRALATVRET